MTLEEFRALRSLQDHRVHMIFADGQEVIATLLSVTTDMDESRHLIYDKVEWSAIPHLNGLTGPWYLVGEDLVICSAYRSDEADNC